MKETFYCVKKTFREPGIAILHGPTSKLHKSLDECMVPRFDMQNHSFFGNSLQGHKKDFQFTNNNFTTGELGQQGKKAFFSRSTHERGLRQRPVSEILLICGQKSDEFYNTLLQKRVIIFHVQDF